MRIIAGEARGRLIEAPAGRATRPTLDRVREAMFGMVQFDVENANVLDLFAGSGALGLEAISRGAKHVVFCDNSREACALIEKNLAALKFTDRASVHCTDCFSMLKRLSLENKRFSLVLLDPPYQSDLYQSVIDSLISLELLEDGCIVLAEHPHKMQLDLNKDGITLSKPHKYGDIAVTKFKYSCC